jgi:L-lactate dehydrogenase (cytochrome)
MDFDHKYPALSDLKRRAKRRLPHFVWEYLDSATGKEDQKNRNRAALDAILFDTAVLKGTPETDLSTTILGQKFATPFGIAPIGMSGLIWPNAETHLAKAAVGANIPYCLSTVATQSPEDLAPNIGKNGWFQLYPPKDKVVRRDLLKRAKDAGFHTLIITLDVSTASRRERQRRADLRIPPVITPSMITQSILNPTWALGTLMNGLPRLKTMEQYAPIQKGTSSTEHIGYVMRAAPDWGYFRELRDEWDGPLIAKSITNPTDAVDLVNAGADAIWVSNHSGRQFDGGPAAIDMLPPIRAAVGPSTPIIFDSGIESGLDILRALALGANFTMLGRGFHYALAALGPNGVQHLIHLLSQDLTSNMGQLGIDQPFLSATRVRTESQNT